MLVDLVRFLNQDKTGPRCKCMRPNKDLSCRLFACVVLLCDMVEDSQILSRTACTGCYYQNFSADPRAVYLFRTIPRFKALTKLYRSFIYFLKSTAFLKLFGLTLILIILRHPGNLQETYVNYVLDI